jgi:hypothetical protein
MYNHPFVLLDTTVYFSLESKLHPSLTSSGLQATPMNTTCTPLKDDLAMDRFLSSLLSLLLPPAVELNYSSIFFLH